MFVRLEWGGDRAAGSRVLPLNHDNINVLQTRSFIYRADTIGAVLPLPSSILLTGGLVLQVIMQCSRMTPSQLMDQELDSAPPKAAREGFRSFSLVESTLRELKLVTAGFGI
ncbi:hypothetical protein BDW69DRAFT_163723 [Aspergillus filifer]